MSSKKWVADRVQQAFDSVDMTGLKYLTHPMARAAFEDLHASRVLLEAEPMLHDFSANDVRALAYKLRTRALLVIEAMREAERCNEAVDGVAVDKAPSNDGE